MVSDIRIHFYLVSLPSLCWENSWVLPVFYRCHICDHHFGNTIDFEIFLSYQAVTSPLVLLPLLLFGSSYLTSDFNDMSHIHVIFITDISSLKSWKSSQIYSPHLFTHFFPLWICSHFYFDSCYFYHDWIVKKRKNYFTAYHRPCFLLPYTMTDSYWTVVIFFLILDQTLSIETKICILPTQTSRGLSKTFSLS